MRDWRALVRARLALLSLNPADELAVADEIAQHLEDRFEQCRAEGLTDEEAARRTASEIEGQEMPTDLADLLSHR